jgi:hypothetical protein
VKALSTDSLSDSATIFGAYNVLHDLELWYNFESDWYYWLAKLFMKIKEKLHILL